jgi:type IV pilus assembly protein PilW
MMRRTPPSQALHTQRGLSLVELMVSVAIGMVIVAAMSLLYANNSRTQRETERAGVKMDNGRYALEALARDLQHAGYLAQVDVVQWTAPPTAKPRACETDDTTLAGALSLPVLGYDNVDSATLGSSAIDCLGSGTAVPGSDIVVVRRASTCADGSAGCTRLEPGGLALQASSCNGASELGGMNTANYFKFAEFPGSSTFNLRQRDCTTPAPIFRYIVRIYFIAPNDKDSDGIPSLKRLELGPGGRFTSSDAITIAPGIENLQVEWGLDTNDDGSADLYATDPDRYCATASPLVPGGICWTLPVSAKIHLLARNLDASPGHEDRRQYLLGKAGHSTTGISTAADYVVGPFTDSYKRAVYQRTVALQNVTTRKYWR